MTLERVSKIKGWVALALFLPGLFLSFLYQHQSAASTDRQGAAVLAVVGFLLGVSWIRQRRRMRELDFQARAFQKPR